jgi:2-methylisocitrate lyase-like PEP mutase family enzyme
MDGVPSNDRLTELGVSRISYGPLPYIRAMSGLQQEAREVLSSTPHLTQTNVPPSEQP